jgi:hypothetical protein
MEGARGWISASQDAGAGSFRVSAAGRRDGSERSRALVAADMKKKISGRARGTKNSVQEECRMTVGGEGVCSLSPINTVSLYLHYVRGEGEDSPARNGQSPTGVDSTGVTPGRFFPRALPTPARRPALLILHGEGMSGSRGRLPIPLLHNSLTGERSRLS